MATEFSRIIAINGVQYYVDKDRTDALRWKTTRITTSPEEAAARNGEYIPNFIIPFGHNGIGQSYWMEIPQEVDDALDVQMELTGELGPGYQVNSMGFAGAQITRLVHAVDANQRFLVYAAGAGGATTLAKITIDDTSISATGQPLNIAGGAAVFGASITDVVVLKSGNLTTISTPRYGTQPGNGVMLILFGEAARIGQCDAIAVGAGADTYLGAGAGVAAYGGRGIVSAATSNTAARVYLSCGFGSPPNLGSFSRVYSTEVSTSAIKDYTDSANWTATPYQVGAFGSSINDFAEYNNGIACGKAEGIYGLRPDGNTFSIRTFRGGMYDGINGRNLTAWGDSLYCPTRADIATPSGMVGVNEPQLESQRSVLGSYPTAMAAWGEDLFVAYYDGTDSRIYRMRQRRNRGVPNTLMVYPVTKIAGKMVTALLTVTNTFGTTFLMIGDTDVRWIIINPPSRVRYTTGGTITSPTYIFPTPIVVESLVYPYVRGTSGTNYITPSISWDGGATYTALSTLTGTGRQVVYTTPGSGDSGVAFKLKHAWTTTSNTNRPYISAAPGNRGLEGGVKVNARMLPARRDAVDAFEVVLLVGRDSTYGLDQELPAAWAALKALEGTTTDIVYANHYGNTSTHLVQVLSCAYETGPGESAQNGEFYVTLRLKDIIGNNT